MQTSLQNPIVPFHKAIGLGVGSVHCHHPDPQAFTIALEAPPKLSTLVYSHSVGHPKETYYPVMEPPHCTFTGFIFEGVSKHKLTERTHRHYTSGLTCFSWRGQLSHQVQAPHLKGAPALKCG